MLKFQILLGMPDMLGILFLGKQQIVQWRIQRGFGCSLEPPSLPLFLNIQ